MTKILKKGDKVLVRKKIVEIQEVAIQYYAKDVEENYFLFFLQRDLDEGHAVFIPKKATKAQIAALKDIVK